MKTACVYHNIDLDGWMSAAIVKHWFLNNNKNGLVYKSPYLDGSVVSNKEDETSLTMLGFNYGDEIPNLLYYDKIIMCDISFPKEEMLSLNLRLGTNFVWIDHHQRTIDETNQFIIENGIPMEGLVTEPNELMSACELTWKYFFPDTGMPEIVRLLGRYDCFGHRQIWKSVVDYEGLYEVSNHGNVRSLHKETKELSIANSKRGYRVVSLYKDGNATMKNVHQLVAQAFIPNPENKPCINHKDFNRLNNYVENLEWCTYAENNLHSIEEGKRGKTVIQLTRDGEFIEQFDSIKRAESHTGIASQNIGKVCKGEREFAGKYKWEYGIDKNIFPQFVPQDEEQKVLEFQYGARAFIPDYETAYYWLSKSLNYIQRSKIDTTPEDDIYSVGKAIYQYLCSEAKQTYKNGFPISFPRTNRNEDDLRNYYFVCINKERFNPINFGIDYHKDGYDGCACFHYANGMWNFSLYNDNGLVDCSQIAKQYGGGGHRGSSGMRLNNTQFLQLING